MKMKFQDVNQTMNCDIQFSKFFNSEKCQDIHLPEKSLTIYDAFVDNNTCRQQKNHTNI